MALLNLVRIALFGVLLVFSLIVLGLSANLLSISRSSDHTFSFEGLCVAVSVITFITVIPIMVIDFIRRGAITSLMVVELGWVFVLMVLWVAAAADTSSAPVFTDGCSDLDNDNGAASNCHQFQAIQAFAWLNFIILLGWLIILLVGGAINHSKGHTRVWKTPVSETALFGRGAGASAGTGAPAVEAGAAGYPPQQMQQHGPEQVHRATPPPHQATPALHPTPSPTTHAHTHTHNSTPPVTPTIAQV